jgi:CubicO group peptidase (beta-lactamase class C family)
VCCLSFLTPYSQSVIKNLQRAVVEKDRLESSIKQVVDTPRIVGLSVVIINDNKVVYAHTFGVKNKQTNALLNDTTIMYAASFTKPVSAYTFLKLVEKGMFNLDTPVYKYPKRPIGAYEKWKDLATDTAFAR